MVYVGMVPPGDRSGQMKAGRQHIPFRSTAHLVRGICRCMPVKRAAHGCPRPSTAKAIPCGGHLRLAYPNGPHATPVHVRATAANTCCDSRPYRGYRSNHPARWRQGHGYRSNPLMWFTVVPDCRRDHLMWWFPATQIFCAAFFYHISYLCGIFQVKRSHCRNPASQTTR